MCCNKAKGYDRRDGNIYYYKLKSFRKQIKFLNQAYKNKQLFPFYYRNRLDCTGNYCLYENSKIISIVLINNNYYITILLGNYCKEINKSKKPNQIHPYVRACLDNSGFNNIKTHQCPGIYYKSP